MIAELPHDPTIHVNAIFGDDAGDGSVDKPVLTLAGVSRLAPDRWSGAFRVLFMPTTPDEVSEFIGLPVARLKVSFQGVQGSIPVLRMGIRTPTRRLVRATCAIRERELILNLGGDARTIEWAYSMLGIGGWSLSLRATTLDGWRMR